MTDAVTSLASHCFRHHMAFLDPVHSSYYASIHITFTDWVSADAQCSLTIYCICYLFVDIYTCFAHFDGFQRVLISLNIVKMFVYSQSHNNHPLPSIMGWASEQTLAKSMLQSACLSSQITALRISRCDRRAEVRRSSLSSLCITL